MSSLYSLNRINITILFLKLEPSMNVVSALLSKVKRDTHQSIFHIFLLMFCHITLKMTWYQNIKI